MKKRLLSMLLVLAMLLGGSVACTTDTPPEDTPDDVTPTISFILDGYTEYTLVRGELAGTEEKNAAAALFSALKKATGADIEITTDWNGSHNAPAPTDTLEILVGNTNRAESQEVLATLGEGEYICTVKGNRLVIVGQCEEATAQAVNDFIANVLGYSIESDSYQATNLVLPVDYAVRGQWVYVKPPVTFNPPKYNWSYPEQNKPTVSPTTYVKPTYAMANGLYVQSYASFDFEGVRTTFQNEAVFSTPIAIQADSVMVYEVDGVHGNKYVSWYEAGDYVIDYMIAVNRGGEDYFQYDEAFRDDIQKTADGSLRGHPTGGQYYMVPTETWTQYVWEIKIKPVLEQFHPQTIVLEEPELWGNSGYSESFKREWLAFYGTEWEDPASSAGAALKCNLLKTYLFERCLTTLADLIKETSPSTQLYIACHSTPSYTAWNITAGLNSYLATGKIDGLIGQTWQDTHNSHFMYNGGNITDNFTNAFIEYCSYPDSVEGTNFYALADPKTDSSASETECRYRYRQSIAAQLMQPEINRFEVMPWANRAFDTAEDVYRTVQTQILQMLNEIGGQEVTLTAGTPGITYLLSDSQSWMPVGDNLALSTTDALYGVCAPLVRDGIPLKMKSLEHIRTAADLEDVTLLLVCYDASVPLSEEVNVAIADWVKAGGTMLYVSGSNEYWNEDSYFFWKDDKDPLSNLLRHLGLDITVNIGTMPAGEISGHGALSDCAMDNLRLAPSFKKFIITFDGASDPILSIGNQTLGFTESVGQGQVVVIGVPSAFFAQYTGGSTMIRELTDYALDYTDVAYVSTPMMTVRRGNYVIAHAYDKNGSLEGTYLDLFDSNLSVLTNPTVPKNDSVILYALDELLADLDAPTLAFTSGTVLKAAEESATQTTWSIKGPASAPLTNRLFAPAGISPKSVTVTDADGNAINPLQVVWEADKQSLLIVVDGTAKEMNITVTWGSDGMASGTVKANHLTGMNNTSTVTDTVVKMKSEESFKIKEQNGRTTYRRTVKCNNTNEDMEFIYFNTAGVNSGLRFCDNDRQLIYLFDVSEMTAATFTFSLHQNYIVEISCDGEEYEIIARTDDEEEFPEFYGKISSYTLKIDPFDYDCSDTGLCYIRIRNTDVSRGNGGSVSQIMLEYTKPN